MAQFSTVFSTTLTVAEKSYKIASLRQVGQVLADVERLPFSLKILLENCVRHLQGEASLQPFRDFLEGKASNTGLSFHPARILLQDFTGVPAIVDLAAMRDAVAMKGGDPACINPCIPVDLVIDHSVMVDFAGTSASLEKNVSLEFDRNKERYQLLHWAQNAFDNFRVVPPGMGICHQVNLEFLAKGVWESQDDSGAMWAYPDTLVGTDSHTTMINGLGILGWGVGGIEAEAAMLGQPVSMLLPQVIGVAVTGKMIEGTTATDLVLTLTHLLRKKGVVGKFVEFYGDGLAHLGLADRATISNMSPEFGATCAYFPIDDETLRYLTLTGRSKETVALVAAYAKEQGLWRDTGMAPPLFSDTLHLDLSTIQPAMAGPNRPQDRVFLPDMPASIAAAQIAETQVSSLPMTCASQKSDTGLSHSDIVIAAITSCTNTSNPAVMIGAGLVAKKAHSLGLKVKPWVKTSFAPGSKVVTAYLQKAGLMPGLEALGFHVVGYGCTTCIGNSGPLDAVIDKEITDNNLCVGAVLSGNRNFEGRIHPRVKLSYLASPPLVVAYALLGTLNCDMTTVSFGVDQQGENIYLKDIWPSLREIQDVLDASMMPALFQEQYAQIFEGDHAWKTLSMEKSTTYPWDAASTYVKSPPYFTQTSMPMKPGKTLMTDGRIIALLGDSVTTDHISPAGTIPIHSPAGEYLQAQGVLQRHFNSYGSRRGNHDLMMRGTFANVRLQNKMTPHVRGGTTLLYPGAHEMSIFDAAMAYQKTEVPLVVFAGAEYGTGSSRDWAAKGTKLLGVKAVIAQSFERIHRSNLVGMGVLPLQFPEGITIETLGLTGSEEIALRCHGETLTPGGLMTLSIQSSSGEHQTVMLIMRLDTPDEVRYYCADGILPYLLAPAQSA